MKKKLFLSLLSVICLMLLSKAQNTFPAAGSAGIGTVAPNASAILEMKSTTQGMLIPRMTIAQRNGIATPATGLMIYQTNATPGFYYYSGAAWTAITPKNKDWSLTGNAATIPGTNFIGTTDQQPLYIKTGDSLSGFISPVFNTTSYGYGALNTSLVSAGIAGNFTSAFGYGVLHNNTTGYGNSAFGVQSLYSNLTGSYNNSFGSNALYKNTSGMWNMAFGSGALYNNTTGSYNVAIGNNANESNGTGNSNVSIGVEALTWSYTGNSNVAVGTRALYWNQNNSNLVAIGDSALFNQYSGNGLNTAMGSKSLFTNESGSANTAAGFQSLYTNKAGSSNTAVGYQALYTNNSGNGNTACGYLADVSSGVLTNATAIGYNSKVNASDKVVIGNTSVSVIGGQVGWSILSDGRFKNNIKENVPGLAFIDKLRPVTYNVDETKFAKFIGVKDSILNAEKDGYAKASQKIRTGFIAQEVEKTAQDINYDFDGVNHPQNDKDNYSIVYADFVPSLVKAIQELSMQNSKLQLQIDELKQAMHTINQSSTITKQSVSLSEAFSLDQNTPNPFNGVTKINCNVPVNNGNVFLNFYNQSGALLKSIKVTGEGKNTITLTANELASGTYKYVLMVDGKIMDSKQMILVK